MPTSILEELDLEGLRAAFLEYTRQAYHLIPAIEKPRILDVGCGSGLPTVELACIGDGEIVAIDPDHEALGALRARIEDRGLGDRVRPVQCSFFDTGFDSTSFDIVWEEGVFHLLDANRALAESARLLVVGGFLVMFETNEWLEKIDRRFRRHGFEFFQRFMLPRGCWWTRYYRPLEERLSGLQGRLGDQAEQRLVRRLEAEIESVKADVSKSDCSFLIVRRGR